MLTEHPPIILWAIPFFLLSLGGEVWYLARQARDARSTRHLVGYEKRDTVASLSMGILSLITGIIIIIGDVPISLFAWEHRIFDLGTGWLPFVVALVAWDFSYYWAHRVGHRVRLFWANHVQHHSSEHYNLSTALRQPVTNFYEWLFFPTLAVFGIQPWLIFAAGSINLIYQYWIHTEAIDRLPRWFEAVFNTPSHHRVHHGSNQAYLDKNYGGILIVWDRLFGTFEPEVEPVVYGLTKNIHTYNVWKIATHEYAALCRAVWGARRWRDRAAHLLRPPGWQPAGAPSPSPSPATATATATATGELATP